MVAADTIRKECPAHSGVCAMVQELQDSDEKQWVAIGGGVSFKAAAWAAGIIVGLILTILGLISAQVENVEASFQGCASRIEATVEKQNTAINRALDRHSDQINVLNTRQQVVMSKVGVAAEKE